MKNFKTKRLLILSLLCVWPVRYPAAAGQAERSAEHSSAPFEDLAQVYRTIESEMPSPPSEISSFPVVKRDRQGRAWAAWEKWETDLSQIQLCRVPKGGMVSSQTISRQNGFNILPDFFFDQTDSPWVIWVNYFNREYRIFVWEFASRRTWVLTPGTSATITSPKIVLDGNDQVWALWNQTEAGKGEVFYRVLDRGNWSPLKKLPQQNDFPAVNPDVVVDKQGRVVVVWSRYDGEDYEIYLSRWEGDSWQKEIRITDNAENDSFPAIAIGPHDALFVSWTKSSRLGNQICFKSLEPGAPAQGISITPPVSQFPLSKIVREGEGMGIVWRSPDGIKIKKIAPEEAGRGSFLSTPHPQGLLYNPSLDENKYICFGDSITYGYMNRLPTPEAGYPLRLEALLNENFGPSVAINEGIGGESTIGGLSRIDSVIMTDAARYILIMEGTNDVLGLHQPIEISVFNLREMIRKCLEAGAFPTLATIIPRRDFLYETTRIIRERHLSLVEQIREIPADFPVSFVDQYEIFLTYPESDGGLFSLLSNDYKHPSEKGYQVMAEAWFNEIKNYPFPPVDVQMTAKGSEGNPFNHLRRNTALRQQKKPLLSPREPLENILTWKDNPKVFDKTRIKGYNIYRKRSDIGGDTFRFRAFVPGTLTFVDFRITILDRHAYVVSAVRDDGVEGPCSEPIN
jgi:lysophospholipase L1-like esterase